MGEFTESGHGKRFAKLTAFLVTVLLFCGATAGAQQGKSALTNADIIKMAKAGLPESAVVATIQANPGNYDISADGLIALKQGGVTPNEMNAIVAVASGTSGPSVGDTTARAPAARFHMPSVAVLQNGGSQALPLEKTQLAETKTKPTSLTSLAGDSAITQAIQAGAGDVTMAAASRVSSNMGNSAVQQAGGILGGMLASRKPTVTYVWGVPGPASANVLQTTTPKFVVDFAGLPGANPNDFAPEIVKLTPAQNTCRLVGATRGKEDAGSHDAADWEIYSSFVEDRVPVTLQKSAEGKYQVSPQSPLYPGEYAVVLRPVSKNERFSGGDVARGQGAGMVFDAAWTFQVSESAQ